MNKIRFTKEGLEELNEKLEDLRRQRPLAVLDLKKAREMGDLSENGYYKAARFRLSEIDRNLRYYSYQVKNSILIKNVQNNSVGIGSRVELSNGDIFEIVGDLEAKPREKKISLLSPLGTALNGKKVGDSINLKTPKGMKSCKIISIT